MSPWHVARRNSGKVQRGGPQKLDHWLSEKSALLPTQEQANEGEADEAQPGVQGEGGAGSAARGRDGAGAGAALRRAPVADLRVEEAVARTRAGGIQRRTSDA